jgi:hypothetical protein
MSDVLGSRIRAVPKKQTSDFPVPGSQRHPQRSQLILILRHRVRTVLQKHASDRRARCRVVDLSPSAGPSRPRHSREGSLKGSGRLPEWCCALTRRRRAREACGLLLRGPERTPDVVGSTPSSKSLPGHSRWRRAREACGWLPRVPIETLNVTELTLPCLAPLHPRRAQEIEHARKFCMSPPRSQM